MSPWVDCGKGYKEEVKQLNVQTLCQNTSKQQSERVKRVSRVQSTLQAEWMNDQQVLR